MLASTLSSTTSKQQQKYGNGSRCVHSKDQNDGKNKYGKVGSEGAHQQIMAAAVVSKTIH
jgi:hypothetical protein